MQAPPMPDAESQNFLASARRAAVASLKGKLPDPATAQLSTNAPIDVHISGSSGIPSQGSAQGSAPTMPPPPPPLYGLAPGEFSPTQDGAPPAPPPPPPPTDAEAPNVGGFLKAETKGMVPELGTIVPVGAAHLLAGSAQLFGTPGALTADAIHSMITGKTEHGAIDNLYNGISSYLGTQDNSAGVDKNAGGIAQAVGQVGRGALPLVLGPPGIVTSAMGDEARAQAQTSHTAAVATTLTLIAGATAALGYKIPLKSPNILLRMARAAGFNAALSTAAKGLAYSVLRGTGYLQDASKINPLDSQDLVKQLGMGVAYGLVREHEQAAIGAPKRGATAAEGPAPTTPEGGSTLPAAPPPPPSVGGATLSPGEGPVPPPPGAPEAVSAATAPAPEVAPVPGAPVSAAPSVVPDHPTAEPAVDLKAQFADMADPKTPRQGVLVAGAPLDRSLNMRLVQAAKTQRIVNIPGVGPLVLKTPDIATEASARLAAGEDPQKVIGDYTGAGTGKQPDQTAVVQGQTPEGAVATETAVTPQEVPGAAQEAAAQGKTPVVTTPEAAVARRAAMIGNEAAPPGPEATPASPPPGPEATPASPPPGPEAAPLPFTAGQRRIVRINNEDVPVVVAGASVNGRVPVHLIDEVGRISKTTQQAPEHLFNRPAEAAPVGAAPVGAASPEAASPEAAPPEAAPTTALGKAVAFFKSESAAGRGTLGEHAQRVAALARAVHESAKTADVPDNVREHAVAAARAVEKVDQKTPEEIAKGRGVSHRMLEQHTQNLLRAAANLEKPEEAVLPEQPVAVKATRLKEQRAKAQEKANENEPPPSRESTRPAVPASEASAPKVESGIRDVEDETKPKAITRADDLRIRKAVENYRDARSSDDVAAKQDALEKILHEVYGPKRVTEVENLMQMVREARADEAADHTTSPKRMSETVNDSDFRGSAIDESDDNEGIQAEFADHVVKQLVEASPEGRLHAALQKTGLWARLRAIRDSRAITSTHQILDHMIRVAHRTGNIEMGGLLAKIRAKVPDVPLRPSDRIGRMNKTVPMSENTAGVFHGLSATTQIRIRGEAENPDTVPFSVTHSIVHETAHAATMYEIHTNPKGELNQRLVSLRAEALRRAKIMGPEYEDQYGFKDSAKEGEPLVASEFAAEALSDPVFRKFLRASESVAGEKPGSPHLLSRVIKAVRDFMWVSSPAESKLFDDTMRTLDEVMDANAKEAVRRGYVKEGDTAATILKNMDPAYRARLVHSFKTAAETMPGLEDDAAHAVDLDTLAALMDPPPPLPHDDEFREVVGDHATEQTRMFRRAVRSGAIEAVRRSTRAFTGFDQLVRTALRRRVFGTESPVNPLRVYHENILERDAHINRIVRGVGSIVNARAKLSDSENEALGQFQIDSTQNGIDPREPLESFPKKMTDDPKFAARLQEFQNRWGNLSDAQQDIYARELSANESAIRAYRKAAVDASLSAYSEKDVPKSVRALLYSVKAPHQYSDIIGSTPNHALDLGADQNEKLIHTLVDLGGLKELQGPYFHLGRYGEHVVQAQPAGTKIFDDEASARRFASSIEGLSPNSKAKVEMIGGKWQVDYKAEYTSMQESPAAADAAIERLRSQGITVGPSTIKLLSARNANLAGGVESLIAEATRRMERHGADAATKEAQEVLRQSFVQVMAARSSYAGSKLARRNIGGVQAGEMGRSFATHIQALTWNTGHIASAFKLAESLGRLRQAVKDPEQSQNSALARGRLYDELTRRLAQENLQFGTHQPFNSLVAKAGFANYMLSFGHALVYLTQNFTAATPLAMIRYGKFRAARAFARSMSFISGPAFRETYRAMATQTSADKMIDAILGAIAKDPRYGKWAQGENSPIQQIIDQGAIRTSMSNQLAETAKGGNPLVNKTFEYARIIPSMADIFNRVSTALATLELTNGDVYKTGDFIRETHIDYSQGNKPRAFRAAGRLWGGNSVTMFRSYTQGMAHLLYSHIFDAITGQAEGGRGQALKTVAGAMLGATAFAGVQKGTGIEPLRALMWAYNRLVGDNDKYYSFDNMTRSWVKEAVGTGKLADAINHGLPSLANTDISYRMGLSDLFFYDPPDLSSMDNTKWAQLGASLLGPEFEQISNEWRQGQQAFESGRISDFAKLIPVKIVRDAMNAYQSGTTGTITGSGAKVTNPSAWAATVNAMGLKTNEQSKIGEKGALNYNYRDWAQQKQYAYAKEWMQATPAERPEIWARARHFSINNPVYAVTRSVMIRQARGIMRTERMAQGQPNRDPVENKLDQY